jgi:hypothetical protein
MNENYPRKHKKPAIVGVSMNEDLKQKVAVRAAFHNAKGKMSPYIVDILKHSMDEDPAPGWEQTAKEALEFIKNNVGEKEELITKLETFLPLAQCPPGASTNTHTTLMWNKRYRSHTLTKNDTIIAQIMIGPPKFWKKGRDPYYWKTFTTPIQTGEAMTLESAKASAETAVIIETPTSNESGKTPDADHEV